MFDIKDGSDLSLSQIHTLHAHGTSVLRSAHVGNFNPATLFVAQEKFPIILDEHTKGNLRIFRSGYIRKNNEEACIADNPELPTTHMLIQDTVSEIFSDLFFIKYTRPAQLHFGALQKLFPESIKLTSTFLLEQEQFVTRVLKIFSQNDPTVFKKYRTKEGKVYEQSGAVSKDIYQYKDENGDHITVHTHDMPKLVMDYARHTHGSIAGNDTMCDGITLSTNADILFITLCDIYKGRNGIQRYRPDKVSVIHFSGVEMMNYMIKNRKQAGPNAQELQELYTLIKSSLSDLLPENIEFLLVPTDMFSKLLAATETDAKRHSLIFTGIRTLKEAYKKEKEVWKKSSEQLDQEVCLDNATIHKKIENLLKRADTLPGRVKKRVLKAKDMLKDIESNKTYLTQLIVKDELFSTGSYPKNSQRNEAVKVAKQQLQNTCREIEKEIPPQVTQYDMMAGSNLFFPEEARDLSQTELKSQWNQAFRT